MPAVPPASNRTDSGGPFYLGRPDTTGESTFRGIGLRCRGYVDGSEPRHNDDHGQLPGTVGLQDRGGLQMIGGPGLRLRVRTGGLAGGTAAR